MNSAMPGSNMLPSLLPSSAGNGRSSLSGTTASDGNVIDFKRIINGELMTPEGMAKLQDMLPPDQLSQLEALLENGNGLPFSADIADPANALSNPSLLQWMLQLTGAEGVGEEIAATLGVQSTPGVALTAADLRAALLRQGAGGNSVNVETGQGSRPVNPADAQTALLLTKGEITNDTVGVKPSLFTGDLPAGVLNGNGVATATPLSAVVSGLEQISTQRSEVYTPPAISVPVGEKGWDNVLSNRVMWMVGSQMQQASLHVTPRHLGPVDIQVSIQNDQTNISFLTNNAAVKEALESAIPRLREMFADNNMQLVNVDVAQRDAGEQKNGMDLFQQAGAGGGGNFTANGQRGGDADSSEELGPVRVVTSSGLVDDYA